MREVHILTNERCNGEYCETVHCSVHDSLEAAMLLQTELVNPEHLKGEGAANKWEKSNDGGLEFRTGNWGFVVWKIKSMPLFEGTLNSNQIEGFRQRMKYEESDKLGYIAELMNNPGQPFDWKKCDEDCERLAARLKEEDERTGNEFIPSRSTIGRGTNEEGGDVPQERSD